MPSISSVAVASGLEPSGERVSAPVDAALAPHAFVLATLAVGRTRIRGVAESDDLRVLVAALRELGATILLHADGLWSIDGVGIGGLREPETALDLGSSAVALPLLMGVLATHPVTAIITGDAALRQQPLTALTLLLSLFGACFAGRQGDFLPLALTGSIHPVPAEYFAPDAAATSAVLLAALNTPGRSSVIEAMPGEDRLESLLRAFGATVLVEELGDGTRRISLDGQPELSPVDLSVADNPPAVPGARP